MITAHPNIQQVIQALRQTSQGNGAEVDISEERIFVMLKDAKLNRRIENITMSVLQVLLTLINRSGLGSIKDGLLPALPRWISDATIIVKGCGPNVLKKRVQRLASAMNAGIVRRGAMPMNDPSKLWGWIKPLEPCIARMTDEEFENLIKFHNVGCGLDSAKYRVRHLPGDIRIQTKGRVVVPTGLPLP